MTKTEADAIAKETAEGIADDIVTTCEGVPADVEKVRAAVVERLTRLKLT